MIFYFSGTGNSKFVASEIAKATNDDLVSMNLLIKKEKEKKLVKNMSSIVFVTPTYAWRLPRVVESFIKNTTFEDVKQVYFIMTCDSQTGNAIGHIQKLCTEKGWKLCGFAEIIMPENYLALMSVPDVKKAKSIIDNAIPTIDQVTHDIINNNSFMSYRNQGIYGKVMSSLANALYYPILVHAKGFHVSNHCTGCTKCEKLCPLNNIIMDNHQPIWKDNCTHCMACIAHCPVEAIEYKRKSKGQSRYYFEKVYR